MSCVRLGSTKDGEGVGWGEGAHFLWCAVVGGNRGVSWVVLGCGLGRLYCISWASRAAHGNYFIESECCTYVSFICSSQMTHFIYPV